MLKTLVFNGWAAGYEAWNLCDFQHDWLFSYVEQLDGLPERVMDDSDEVLLVGWSMGGSTALRMALRAPEKVRGLVLVAATPRMMEDKATGWRGMSERRLAALWLGTKLVFRDDPAPVYDLKAMERGLDYLRTTDLREPLKTLNARFGREVPVRIFQSARDGIVRPDNATFLKSVFPQAEVTLVPGGEHVLPVAVPEAISAAVCDLQRNEAVRP